MLSSCVTEPSRTNATFWIEEASGVPIWICEPYPAALGAELIVGRGASCPDPSFLNR